MATSRDIPPIEPQHWRTAWRVVAGWTASLAAALSLALTPQSAAALDLREIAADLAVTPAQIERLRSWENAKIHGARAASELPDPYGHPEYMRIGNFLLINRIDTALTYDSNVFATAGAGRADLKWQTSPLLVVRSDLPRHIFDLQISGATTRHLDSTRLDHDDASMRLAAIFHLDHAHILALRAGMSLTHEDRLTFGAAANAVSLTPILHSFAAVGLKRDAGRLWASTGISHDAWSYEDGRDVNGNVLTQRHRNLTQTATDLKLGYRFSPGFELLGRLKGVRQVNEGNVNIDTTAWGIEGVTGIRLEMGALLRLAFEGGYGIRDYDRPGVETAGIGLIEGRLTWLIAPSLTANLSVRRSFDDGVTSAVTAGGSGGRVLQMVAGRLDYWASRNLMFTIGGNYAETAFQDNMQVDVRLTGRAGLVRHVGPNLQVTVDIEHVDQRSPDPASDIRRSQISAGARVRF